LFTKRKGARIAPDALSSITSWQTTPSVLAEARPADSSCADLGFALVRIGAVVAAPQ